MTHPDATSASDRSYTGRVRTGGPSDVRTLREVVIRKASVGTMDNNAYLLTCRRTGHQLLVDAAADPDRLLDLVREGSGSARLGLVVTTHQHADHHGALEDMVAVTGATCAAGAEDADALGVRVERRLRSGDRIAVGDVLLEVLVLRGHTPGSVALVYTEPGADASDDTAPAPSGTEDVPGRSHIFTGDSLFPGGVGNTGGDPERFTRLLDDVTREIFDRYPDDTWIYPGHGADTTVGAERPALGEWRERGW